MGKEVLLLITTHRNSFPECPLMHYHFIPFILTLNLTRLPFKSRLYIYTFSIQGIDCCLKNKDLKNNNSKKSFVQYTMYS